MSEEIATNTAASLPQKVSAVRAFAETILDPVFKKSLGELADAMNLAMRFKRIDIAFLQIRGESNLPKFALLDYDAFKNGLQCTVNQSGYLFANLTNSGQRRFGELFQRGAYFADQQCTPKHVIPETVAAIVEQERDNFDEVLVAWEADWQPVKGDPIVIGRLGGFYYVLATWDLSKVETFVVNTFVG